MLEMRTESPERQNGRCNPLTQRPKRSAQVLVASEGVGVVERSYTSRWLMLSFHQFTLAETTGSRLAHGGPQPSQSIVRGRALPHSSVEEQGLRRNAGLEWQVRTKLRLDECVRPEKLIECRENLKVRCARAEALCCRWAAEILPASSVSNPS